MSDDRPLFILAGNGPYDNRGCEAIVRGTVEILRKEYKNPQFVCLSHFQNEEHFRNQCRMETDPAITHLQAHTLNKEHLIKNFWRPKTLKAFLQLLFKSNAYHANSYADMLPFLSDAIATLSVGGDNYHIDGRKPTSFIALDNLVIAQKRPLVIWGASIGPFSRLPNYEKFMSNHLREVTGIFARESATIEYLENIGVFENVFAVADPAFLLSSIKPDGADDLPIDGEAIGINLSQLMAKYITSGDSEAWCKMAAHIIEKISQKTGMPIYLIPHVTGLKSNDDYVFMQKALSLVSINKKDITLVPPIYNAAETKWIIKQMTLFAGARTHSTIAALSNGIPTLSFAYSIKARGINRDIYGNKEYCMEPAAIDAEAISRKISSMLDNKGDISRYLAEQMPRFRMAALSAGIKLKQLSESYENGSN